MKNLNTRIIFISMLLFTFTSYSHGVAIYVDNSLPADCVGNYSIANRDNSGSDGDAYVLPQDAADVVNPGDIVYFRAGTYTDDVNLKDAAVVMNVLRNGTVMKKSFCQELAHCSLVVIMS